MIDLNLQLFGGRGASGGESLGNGGGEKPTNIKEETDIWTYRHRKENEPFVDDINGSVRQVNDDFPGLTSDTITEVNSAVLGGRDKERVLGFYGDKRLALNENYTNVDKMNSVYDQAVSEGYHPGRGNKTGVEAVTYHELGHALTDHVSKKAGITGVNTIDRTSEKIVNDAYKASKGRGGTKAWAGKISGYAKESYAECVAEAVADWYCNGSKATKQSKAIMTELRKYK